MKVICGGVTNAFRKPFRQNCCGHILPYYPFFMTLLSLLRTTSVPHHDSIFRIMHWLQKETSHGILNWNDRLPLSNQIKWRLWSHFNYPQSQAGPATCTYLEQFRVQMSELRSVRMTSSKATESRQLAWTIVGSSPLVVIVVTWLSPRWSYLNWAWS